MRRLAPIFPLLVFLLAGITGSNAAAEPPDAGGPVMVAELRGPITPATVEYVRRAVQKADQEKAELLVFEMDTPGGLVASTEEIIQSLLASKTPVAVLVTPSGAMATSAGLYIANAADLIAMSPGTRIGAGHPVSISGGGRRPGKEEKGGRDYMDEKIENDLAAGVRSIASQRGRNAEVYEKMVRESISLTEREAVDQKVVDMIAGGLPDMLSRIDGRKLTRFDGSERVLRLRGAADRVTRIPMTMRERTFSWIANPEIAFILLGVGILGLFVEFNNPGLIAPGVIGGLALVLFALSVQILPVNVLGLLLVALGAALFILEIKFTSHGLLTAGGVAALTLGFLVLFDTDKMPELRLSLAFILPTSLTLALVMATVTAVAARAQRARVVTGVEALPGETGEAVTDIGERGKVFVHGEYWNATSAAPIAAGTRIRVTAVRNMILEVKPGER